MYKNNEGDIAWMDLTVPNAEQVKSFYQAILGWHSEPTKMTVEGETYQDFTMTNVIDSDENKEDDNSSEKNPFVTGICHAKGANKDFPAQWLPYFLVADLDRAIAKVNSLKGDCITDIQHMGDDRYIVIKDPAGAACALYQKA
ncbi:MAG: VOC family protein [Colwellia sp.]